MWIANGWKEYEVIDTSCGEKLERWGKYLLVRPDPQVIWDTPKTEPGWRKMNAHYHRSSKGGGEWEFFDLPSTPVFSRSRQQTGTGLETRSARLADRSRF